MDPRVSVIILNYNGWDDTLHAVKSITDNETYKSINIVVIDNASFYNCSDRLEKLCTSCGVKFHNFPDVNVGFDGEVIFRRLEVNRGFGGGCNEGISMALGWEADYVWLLNNDVVIGSGALFHLLCAMKKRAGNIAIAGSKIYCYPAIHMVQFDGRTVAYKGEEASTTEEGIFETTFVMAASMLINSQFLRKHGFLREDYFLYFEDNEICLRAIRHGYSVIFQPRSIVYHKGGATIGDFMESPGSIYYAVRNSLYFYEEWNPPRMLYTIELLEKNLFPSLIRAKKANILSAIVRAIEDYFLGKIGAVHDGNFSWSRASKQEINRLTSLGKKLIDVSYNSDFVESYFNYVKALLNKRNIRRVSV